MARSGRLLALGMMISLIGSLVYADDTFNNLVTAKKYDEAIKYADEKLTGTDRTADVWVKLAQANEELGLTEKALACYMVSWRMNPNDYGSLLGAARIYNKLDQPEQAMTYAKKALDQNFTGEASWEYARACIKLKRSAEAKKALEKVIETDPANIIANRELGVILFQDKTYDKAIPLLKKAVADKPDINISFMLGKSFLETNDLATAITYLKEVVKGTPSNLDAGYLLAMALYNSQSYKEASDEFTRISKIGQSLTADDLYKWANAAENSGDLNKSIEIFKSCISKYGLSKATDAITARIKVARYEMTKKNYQGALVQLEFLFGVEGINNLLPEIHFMLADAYEGIKTPAKAIEVLEKKITVSPSSIEAYARVADLYSKSGNPEKAKLAYEKLITLRPDDPQVYFILGEYYLKAEKFEIALGHYQKSNTLKSDALSAQGIALCASKLGKWDIAQEAALAAIAKNPDLIDSRIVLAESYLRDKNYAEARKHLENIVIKKSGDVDYWKKLSLCYEQLADVDKLADADRKVVALDKKDTVSRIRLSQYCQNKKDLKGALDIYKELSVLLPQDVRVFKNLYEISMATSNKQDAAKYLKQYLILKPADAMANKILGDILYELKDTDGSLAAYDNALRLDPAIKGFFRQYTDLVLAKGQQDKIIKVSLAAIKNNEADTRTYLTLGLVYQKLAQYKSALEMYQKGLQLDPQNIDALVALAECQNKTGDINGAIISYEQAVMMNTNIAPKELKTLADLYKQQGKNDQAMNTYKKYLDKMPSDQAAAREVSAFCYAKKQYDDAIKYLSIITGEAATTVSYQVTLGNCYFFTGQFQKAIDLFEEARKKALKPATLAEFAWSLATSYEKLGNEAKAGEIYALFPSAGIINADAAYKSANYREKTAPAIAAATYEKNIIAFPRDYRNFYRLGIYYSMDKSTYDKAITMLKKTASLADTITEAWVSLAQIYRKLNKEQDEMIAWKKLLTFQPQHVEANARLGTILMKNNQVNEGMVYLEMANTLSGKDPDVMSLLANGYIKTNRVNEAATLLAKAKLLKPDDTNIRSALYEVYMKTNQPKKAMDEIKELVDKTHDNKYLLLYAQNLYNDNKIKESEDAIETILASVPDNLDVLMLKALIQRSKKKYDDAIEVYKEISNIDPNYIPAIYERAEVYMLQAKVKWAETFYERALRADPKFVLAELGLAKVAKMLGDKTKYQEHLNKAKAIDPENKLVKEEIAKSGK